MKHKKSESIWDATGSHTYYTVHKNKPIFKASSHTEPLLVILEMDGGEFTPSSEKPFSPGMFRAILTTGILCCLL